MAAPASPDLHARVMNGLRGGNDRRRSSRFRDGQWLAMNLTLGGLGLLAVLVGLLIALNAAVGSIPSDSTGRWTEPASSTTPVDYGRRIQVLP